MRPAIPCLAVAARLGFFATVCLAASSAHAEGVFSDIPYRTAENDWEQNLNNLDIYTPDEGTGLPVVVYIHGGGWAGGDKIGVYAQPAFYNANAMVYVSINHRVSFPMAPDPHIFPIHPRDVAEAIAWIHANIAEYQGDPERIVVTGHSSGAHLAALVSVDPRYLEAHGLGLDAIKATIPLDGGDFDFEARYPTLSTTGLANFNLVFGTDIPYGDWAAASAADVEIWREASPIEYVGDGAIVPPFLFIKAGTRTDTQDEDMAAVMNANPANEATVWVAEDENHAGVNTGLGEDGHPMNPVVLDFIAAALQQDPAGSETTGGADTTSATGSATSTDDAGGSDGAGGDNTSAATTTDALPGDDASSGGADEPPADDAPAETNAGCGCGSAPSGSGWLVALAGLLGVRRRVHGSTVSRTSSICQPE